MNIVRAYYTKEIDKYGYSELVCQFQDSSTQTFHFHASNPMPNIVDFLGETWDYLIGYCKALWYMYIDMSCDCKILTKHYFILKGESE